MQYNQCAKNTDRLEQQAKLIFELECQMHDVKKRLEQLEECIRENLKQTKEKS